MLMSSLKKYRRLLMGILAVTLCALIVWAYYPTFSNPAPLLSFHWEGFLDRKLNFRDAGASINSCAGTKLLPEGQLFRASGFFSGWSCDRVGQPDAIYSLNYSDSEARRYYCRSAEGLRIGQAFQQDELSDLEFIETWRFHPEFVRATCEFLQKGLEQINEGHRVLYHCEAGRDRTGAVTSLVAGWLLEEHGSLSDTVIDAIECDYRKSESLKPYKYGRIKSLLTELRDQHGGVRNFIKAQCNDFEF